MAQRSKLGLVWAFAFAASTVTLMPTLGSAQSRLPLAPVGFETLRGWTQDDHAAAFAAFRQSCAPLVKSRNAFSAPCAAALKMGRPDRAAARRFFEDWFTPHVVRGGAAGFLTGYYEPELNGSRKRGGSYQVPVYGKPKDHVAVSGRNRPRGFPSQLEFARAAGGGGLKPFPTRGDIEQGALDGDPSVRPILWLDDWVDAFFMHVQGSGRVRMDDGSTVRLSFAAKSGYPYTSIGKVLVDAGELPREAVTMESIKTWLRADPERGRRLMWRNQSFIFFRELSGGASGPVGGQGVGLTAGRSLAVDRSFHTLGTPIFVESDAFRLAGAGASRLMVAQDVGSAIKGPQRGDIFWGSGAKAGQHAGVTKHPGRFVVLLPKKR